MCVCVCVKCGGLKQCHTVMEDFPAVFPCLSRALVSFLWETIWNKQKHRLHKISSHIPVFPIRGTACPVSVTSVSIQQPTYTSSGHKAAWWSHLSHYLSNVIFSGVVFLVSSASSLTPFTYYYFEQARCYISCISADELKQWAKSTWKLQKAAVRCWFAVGSAVLALLSNYSESFDPLLLSKEQKWRTGILHWELITGVSTYTREFFYFVWRRSMSESM